MIARHRRNRKGKTYHGGTETRRNKGEIARNAGIAKIAGIEAARVTARGRLGGADSSASPDGYSRDRGGNKGSPSEWRVVVFRRCAWGFTRCRAVGRNWPSFSRAPRVIPLGGWSERAIFADRGGNWFSA